MSEANLQRARQFLDMDQYARARDEALRCISQDPTDARAFILLSLANCCLLAYPEAREAAEILRAALVRICDDIEQRLGSDPTGPDVPPHRFDGSMDAATYGGLVAEARELLGVGDVEAIERLERLVQLVQPERLVHHAPESAEHLILTYSHEIDFALCHALLEHGFGFAGLIGSETKWARFRKRLATLGHPDARIARICCPIGQKSYGKHPQAIAIGVAAHLLNRETGDGQAWQTHFSASGA